MKIDLSGKTILVTGASRGIGKATALALGKAGGRIAIHYNKNYDAAKALADDIQNGAQCFQADLAKPEQCQALFDEVIKAYHSIDVLINNAGIFFASPLDSENWLEEWNETINVNLRATAHLSRLALMPFQSQQQGIIINIASRAAFRGDNPEHLAYAASKAGMVALTKSIARAYGKDGITSFVVAPGWVETDMNKDTIATYGMDFITDSLALDDLTKPDDIAPMICLLASGMAKHATGTTIHINAGSYMH